MVGFEGLEEKGFQAWMPTPYEYLEGESAAGRNRVRGRWTSEMCQCEGREGVQGRDGVDRQNCWKVLWMTWKYVLQERKEKRLGGDSGEVGLPASARKKCQVQKGSSHSTTTSTR